MSSHGNRARLGGVLVAVAAVLAALVALPGLASGHRNHDGPAPAGTIQSFDRETGVLTIDLTEGGSVSGLVTRRTHIRCDHGRHRGRHGLRHRRRHGLRHKRGAGASASDRRDGANAGGDDRGRDELEPDEDNHGSDEPGEDRGHQGVEPDEDHHGEDRRRRCGIDRLTEGATVKIAVLVLVDGKAVYKLVGLPKQPPADEGKEETEAPPTE